VPEGVGHGIPEAERDRHLDRLVAGIVERERADAPRVVDVDGVRGDEDPLANEGAPGERSDEAEERQTAHYRNVAVRVTVPR
jgi:hypothetical protein